MSATDHELQRLDRFKRTSRAPADPLGAAMVAFFKQSVEKRQTKLTKIAECWNRIVPAPLLEHCSLESFSRGTLVVLVDTSSHLFDLKQLLLAGLQQQLLIACKATGLRKVTLKRGQWYDLGEGGAQKLRFEVEPEPPADTSSPSPKRRRPSR